MRALKSILEVHPEWIIELFDFEEFRKKVWIGHLAKPELKPLLDEFNLVYQEKKTELESILAEAEKEQERWKNIVNLYNDRFDVPFSVSIENQRDVILKQEAAKLCFTYKEDEGVAIVKDKKELVNILSRGEKRAFYILQLLFELEARKDAAFTSIIVFDDIADSFDYQNKYAIIEYIKDLSEQFAGKFVLLVMTHNFDFYRTVASRIPKDRQRFWMALRDDHGNVNLEQGRYVKNLFVNAFIGHDNNDKVFISMIPFVRNLVEYTKGEDDPDYLKLTYCMHQKPQTPDITEREVVNILKDYTQNKGMKRAPTDNKIYELILKTADTIATEQTPNLVLIENKIVLSLAIRHLAEKYMHDKLIAAGKSEADLICSGAQTGVWSCLFKATLPNDTHKDIIERVNMMTPEVIHLNSFMFEPLIDLSLNHLLSLYNKCKTELH